MSNAIFIPLTEKDLRTQYPELHTISEFQTLAARELLFVWWYSNPTSPLNDKDDENFMDDGPDKIGYALKKAYGKKLEHEKEMRYRSMQIPDDTKFAMDRMRRLRPEIRVRANSMIGTILDNYEKLTKVDVDKAFEVEQFDSKGNSTGKYTDFGARKQYIDSMKTISANLPDLIKQAEEGFGVKGKEKHYQPVGSRAIDRLHQSKKENS